MQTKGQQPSQSPPTAVNLPQECINVPILFVIRSFAHVNYCHRANILQRCRGLTDGLEHRLRPSIDGLGRDNAPGSGKLADRSSGPEVGFLGVHWGEGLFVRPRKTQTVAAPGSGTRSGLIRTLRAGRTIAPTLSSVYGLGRLRGQNLAAPVSDGEIASACETTSRDRSHTMCEGRTCLTWTLACESASGAHASPQRLRQSFESDRQSFFRRQLFSRCWSWNIEI